jgi:hypothetical protein
MIYDNASYNLVSSKGQDLALTGGARRLQTFSAVEGGPAVLWSWRVFSG